jgi:DNA-binding CsgD family transcriptional regulator
MMLKKNILMFSVKSRTGWSMNSNTSDIHTELQKQKRELGERVKELNCLYGISRLFTQRKTSLDAILKEALPLIQSGWQYPKKAMARMVIKGQDIRTDNWKETERKLQQRIMVGKKKVGYLEVSYIENAFEANHMVFLDGEEKLIKAIGELIGNMMEKGNAEEALKNKAAELRKQRKELEYKNIALREVLTQIEIEKREMEDQILANVETLVIPILNKLKKFHISPELRTKYIDLVEKNLKQITSSFGRNIREKLYTLSPREIEVCNLVRSGFANKEIANFLRISLLTVERHRHNIRKKLGISNEKINLSTYLMDL